MRVEKKQIRGYLVYLTSIELEDVEDALDDMSVYDSAIDAMAAAARGDAKPDALQLSLDYLIATPAELAKFRGTGFPFSSEELIEVLSYACGRIWPGEPVSGPGEALPVTFV